MAWDFMEDVQSQKLKEIETHANPLSSAVMMTPNRLQNLHQRSLQQNLKNKILGILLCQ